MMVTFWNNLLDPIGREQELGWSAVARMLREPAVFRGDKEHPGWSPATFRDQRRAKDGVRRVFAVCLDYDGGETIEAAVGRWGAFAGVIQTTRKHTAEAPRFRVVLPLARSVSSFEFAALWSRVNAHAGGKLDPAPKDGSRFWFMPGTLEGGTFETRLLSGFDLDPDEWLARPDPEARKAAARIDNSDLDRSDQRIKRALAYVSRMDGAVDGSHGHKATWAVACVLVKGFSLSQRDALGILANDYNPRCQPPWPAKDLEHKIRQAAKADLPDGYLLGDEAPRRSTGASMRDVDIPPEPIEGESHTETPAGGGDFEEEPMREPGDDTEAIELEKANPP